MNTSYRRRAAWVLGFVVMPVSLAMVWYSPLGTTIVFETARKVMEWEIAWDHRRVMADTYGGATPEETIDKYIEAMRVEDYALARRYFTERERVRQEHRFDDIPAELIKKEYIPIIQKTLAQGGTYDSTGRFFSVDGEITILLWQSPNGLWKLLEI